MEININVIDFFRACLETQDGKILYFLTLIALTMIVDFLTGTVAAKVNNGIEFKSKEGINGILRKISSMLLMIIFIPFAVAIPGDVGVGLVVILYIGYELMELKSVIENLEKMGVEVTIFKSFVGKAEDRLGIEEHDPRKRKKESEGK